jgi:hypothetical protein
MSAIELTVNLATRGPLSCVVHCNDDAAAQQLETMIDATRQSAPPGPPEPPGPAGEQIAVSTPISEAMNQFKERMKQKFQPQRNGASITLFRIEADDPLQPQLLGMVIGAAMGAKWMPALESMQKSFAPSSGAPVAGPPGGPAAGPQSADAPAAGPEGVPATVPPLPPGARQHVN